MTTTYWLRQSIIGPQNPVNLTEDEYLDISSARRTLRDAKYFEERYEMLLGNFLDVEMFFSSYALESAISVSYKYDDLSVVFMDANRRVMNLLTTFKSYIDQTPRDFKDSVTSFKQEFVDITRKAFDRSQSYRFISGLRNHVQHYSPPVHRIKGSAKSEQWPKPVNFIVEAKYLREDPDFKHKILDDFDEEIDLRAQIRKFMVEMSEIHIHLRAKVEGEIDSARLKFARTIERYKQHQTDVSSVPGLTICKKTGEKLSDVQSVMLSWDDTRISIAGKNRYPLRITS